FFQTNTVVATELYRQARAWVDEVGPASLWDLYCGVGGFALHCAAPGRAVTGIEISAEAVVAASRTAERLRAGAGRDRARGVATELYRQARAWVDEVGPASLWDLYCGVGGFALHCAAPGRAVTGIEISAEAVVAASGTAERLRAGADGDRFRDVEFAAGDATA